MVRLLADERSTARTLNIAMANAEIGTADTALKSRKMATLGNDRASHSAKYDNLLVWNSRDCRSMKVYISTIRRVPRWITVGGVIPI